MIHEKYFIFCCGVWVMRVGGLIVRIRMYTVVYKWNNNKSSTSIVRMVVIQSINNNFIEKCLKDFASTNKKQKKFKNACTWTCLLGFIDKRIELWWLEWRKTWGVTWLEVNCRPCRQCTLLILDCVWFFAFWKKKNYTWEFIDFPISTYFLANRKQLWRKL